MIEVQDRSNQRMTTKMELSDVFLSQYKDKNPRWGYDGLGYIVYLRTYSRKKADGQMEQWYETVQRVTEGNFSLEAERLQEIGKWTEERKEKLVQEMERFYHLMFNLVITPPGRGLWMSGTDYAKKIGDAENNCWFVSMRPQKYGHSKIQPVIGSIDELLPSMPAVFTFDQAMKGGGVGVNIQEKNTSLMPKVKRKVELIFISKVDHDNFASELQALDVLPREQKRAVFTHHVKDSREGWAESLQLVIDSHFTGSEEVLQIDVSEVRPRGSEIRGFGGIASGPAPLVEMLQVVNRILNRRVDSQVSPVEWGDIIQNIGRCVVAGNVRRTALILIGDREDHDFITSKDYRLETNKEASQWRWASNNSIDLGSDVSRETFLQIAENIYYNGEPGVVDIETAKQFGRLIDGQNEQVDSLVEGFNPCGEITLPNASPCNLFEINLPRIHELIELGIEDQGLYAEACWLATRYAYRITFRPYEWEATREIVYQHRRLGVGITGVSDWALMKFGDRVVMSFTEQNQPVYNERVTAQLDRMYRAVKKTNQLHAEELGADPSIKLTTVKPSGSMSLLMGVSAGMHWHWSPYMIRRVRFAANSPLVPVLIECGYPVEPAVTGFDAEGNQKVDSHTMVAEFPIRAATADHPRFQTEDEVPLREQAALQSMLQTYWSDNAVSATLKFKQAEGKGREGIEEIADVLETYRHKLKATSFLPHAVGTYPQMPLEAISREQYEQKVAQIKAKPWEIMSDSVTLEDDSTDVIGECENGACPIR
ncbi:ribonucleoside-diphosphate reductase alpha chain/ribonucleoside-triphosphate reductase [Seinonella peptonophila]|uniref:Adenosylcobalamin-dependent ribonucleoside-triphosphate reductase n=1 Tax=Seinonella peptonophila TaxID=112248 RepID=A0A1M4SQY5_9BACL|nr:ribonucleoside-triphosphate reductase, adenosylcobalamin-dependent [Seinonella peptonophila]SHE34592.1 ribonucleoside-diphosphate reductase alpha chain/ribonucleoside-triphosphate reductase [Seinonella peptonophila]